MPKIRPNEMLNLSIKTENLLLTWQYLLNSHGTNDTLSLFTANLNLKPCKIKIILQLSLSGEDIYFWNANCLLEEW